MFNTGGVVGDTGTTIIILKGKTNCTKFTEKFLVCHKIDPGLTIIVTANYFMTNGAWHEATKSKINGYNYMSVIRNNLQQAIFKLFDSFRYNEFKIRVKELWAKHIIFYEKE